MTTPHKIGQELQGLKEPKFIFGLMQGYGSGDIPPTYGLKNGTVLTCLHDLGSVCIPMTELLASHSQLPPIGEAKIYQLDHHRKYRCFLSEVK